MSSAFTLEKLSKGLANKNGHPYYLMSKNEAAMAIHGLGLEEVLAGKHIGKPVTFSHGYEIVFSQKLDGSPVRRKRA
jgi:hypothetical protein